MYNLHPAEVFPLVLGFCIVVQEIVFVIAQAISLNQVMTGHCKEPGVFLLPGKIQVTRSSRQVLIVSSYADARYIAFSIRYGCNYPRLQKKTIQ